MDTVTLIENQIAEGQRLLDHLRKEGVVISSAGWLKPTDEEIASFYIASPMRDELGSREGYSRILDVFRSLGTKWLSIFNFKLIRPSHPIAQFFNEMQRRGSHTTVMHLPPSSVDGIEIEDAYVYPTDEVPVTLYRVWYPGAPNEAGTFSLDPAVLNQQFTLTVGPPDNARVYQGKSEVDSKVAAPAGVTLERDEHGRLCLAWDLFGRRTLSTANEVWSLAKLGLHGFRFLRES